jgi:hypothetical protein
VVRSHRREAELVEAALEEQSRVAHASAHQISTPLATKAGRRRRRRRCRPRRLSSGAAHTHR